MQISSPQSPRISPRAQHVVKRDVPLLPGNCGSPLRLMRDGRVLGGVVVLGIPVRRDLDFSASEDLDVVEWVRRAPALLWIVAVLLLSG